MDIEILSQAFCEHAQYLRGRAKRTIQAYRIAINFFSKSTGIRNIEAVSAETVRAFFFFGRTQKNWRTSTYITYQKNLSVFFRWCVSNGYLSHNPIEDMEVPRLENRLPKAITKQDALKLLEIVYNYPYPHHFLRYRNHAIFATFMFAGLRKGELLNLKLTDVDIENLTLFVRLGKGAKDRILPINTTLAQSLKRYLIERKRLKKTCPEFFASLNRDVGFTDIGLRRMVSKIRDASKISFTPHQLRHTFATLMLEGGCDIYSLSRMMGHSDIKTTTIYLSATAEHLREQVFKHPLNRN